MPITQMDCLKTVNMTETIMRLDTPFQFLRDMLFSREQTIDKEMMEIGAMFRSRRMAPFVRSGSSALVVGGRTSELRTVEFPNIRIKTPFNPGDNYFDRVAGETIFGTDMTASRMQERISQDLEDLELDIRQTEEWMVSQAIRGIISYNTPGHDSFVLNYAKPANVTPAATWLAADPAIDVRSAKQSVASVQGGGFQLTDCILGATAATLFIGNPFVKEQLRTDINIKFSDPLDFTANFRQNGSVEFLGRYMGLNMWAYTAQITLPDGTSYDLIRPTFAEFVSNTREADNVMYYGGITDIEALQNGGPRRKRFAKSWIDPDPGTMYNLAQSRPLPVPRNMDSMISYDVG